MTTISLSAGTGVDGIPAVRDGEVVPADPPTLPLPGWQVLSRRPPGQPRQRRLDARAMVAGAGDGGV